MAENYVALTSHQLAAKLMEMPNKPIQMQANGSHDGHTHCITDAYAVFESTDFDNVSVVVIDGVIKWADFDIDDTIEDEDENEDGVLDDEY